MAIRINDDKITDLDTAKRIIEKLTRGLNQCYCATFNICSECGEIYTEGYICWNCGKDNTQ